MRRYIRKVGIVGECRDLDENMGERRSIVVEAWQKLGAFGLTHCKGKRKRRRKSCSVILSLPRFPEA